MYVRKAIQKLFGKTSRKATIERPSSARNLRVWVFLFTVFSTHLSKEKNLFEYYLLVIRLYQSMFSQFPDFTGVKCPHPPLFYLRF